VSATGTEGGTYCECNRDRGWDLLGVQQGQRVGLTVSATETEGGTYCECNRDRGTADRLLVTIAIAAIDIQH
jgi:hypothetical protein